MFGYLMRRILLMIPTLLGISFVTLALVHLAPGDPVQAQMDGAMAKGALSPEEIESLRRTYFLHMPLLLNFSPEDAAVVNQKLIADLTGADEKVRDRNIRRLTSRGGIALPEVMAQLETTSPEGQRALLAGLEGIAARMGQAEALQQASDPKVFWSNIWQQHRTAFTPEVAQAHAADLAAGKEGALEMVTLLDTFALNALFTTLKTTPYGGTEAARIMAALSHATQLDINIRPEDPPAQVARAYDDWQRWWYTRRADYTFVTGLGHLTSLLTETQYFRWVRRVVTLDFDRSSRDNVPVRDKLADRLPRTLLLATLGLMVSYLVAVPLGMYSAVKQYSTLDRIFTVVLFVLYSLPSFWVAMLLQQYVCGVDPAGVEWFPLTGLKSETYEQLTLWGQLKDRIWHLILPILCLSYASLANLSRYQRVGMLDTIRQDYVRTAVAKGLPQRVVIFKHALRNSVIPIITLLGLQLPYLVSGAVIVELIFNIQGMGLETFEAIRNRDLNWIMATVTLTAVLTMVGILLSDLLYALVDPRIQVNSKEG